MNATSMLSRVRLFIVSAALCGVIPGCDTSDDVSDRSGQSEDEGDEEGCDKDGKPRPPVKCDENGEPIPPVDKNGDPLPPPVDENGDPLPPPVDENGDPLPPPPCGDGGGEQMPPPPAK
jgi:hypothetical protein